MSHTSHKSPLYSMLTPNLSGYIEYFVCEERKTALIDQCAAPLVKTEFKNRGAGFPKSGFHSLLLLPPNQVSSALKRSIELFVYFRLFLSG